MSSVLTLTAPSQVREIRLDHLFRMTDDTGMIQHSLHSIPDPKHGYCVDDNARALRFVVRYYRLTGDAAVLPLAYTTLSFLRFAQRENGRFHNFLGFNREWLDTIGSNDSFGRAIMGLSFAVSLAPEPGMGRAAAEMLVASRQGIVELTSLRSMAFASLGLARLAGTSIWEPFWERALHALAGHLVSAYRQTATPAWRWFEDKITYSNSRVPEALITAAGVTGDPEWLQVGLESLDFYLDQVFVDGVLDLVGSEGWYPRGGPKAAFGQQPVDAGCLVETCVAAAEASGWDRYRERAKQAFAWYTGINRVGAHMIDPNTGGCFDGFGPKEINQNQGAESLLSYLNAWVSLQEFERYHR